MNRPVPLAPAAALVVGFIYGAYLWAALEIAAEAERSRDEALKSVRAHNMAGREALRRQDCGGGGAGCPRPPVTASTGPVCLRTAGPRQCQSPSAFNARRRSTSADDTSVPPWSWTSASSRNARAKPPRSS